MNPRTWDKKLIFLGTMALIALTAMSPARSRAQQYDVSDGRFLTEEEYKKLKKSQAEQYCLELENELQRQRERVGDLNGDLTAEQQEIVRLEEQLEALRSQVSEVEAEVSEWESFPIRGGGPPTQYTVKRGECLWVISGHDEVYGDPLKWPRIYRANRDLIKDPDLIYPGWVLTIPQGFPDTWTVYAGEYLSKIASYWEVYDDASAWPRLYEANRDQIRDPDVIHPGQVLNIPR